MATARRPTSPPTTIAREVHRPEGLRRVGPLARHVRLAARAHAGRADRARSRRARPVPAVLAGHPLRRRDAHLEGQRDLPQQPAHAWCSAPPTGSSSPRPCQRRQRAHGRQPRHVRRADPHEVPQADAGLVHAQEPAHDRRRGARASPGDAVDRLFAARSDGGVATSCKTVAAPYPLHVVMQILGVPEEDEQRMLTLTQQMFGGQDEDLNQSGMKDLPPEVITADRRRRGEGFRGLLRQADRREARAIRPTTSPARSPTRWSTASRSTTAT